MPGVPCLPAEGNPWAAWKVAIQGGEETPSKPRWEENGRTGLRPGKAD
jgi:hypothetical protein